MMQPTLPPSPKAAASIFDAIKDGDWEGLATLYATAAYDAVHAAEFARRGGADFHRQQSSPPSLRAAAAGGPGKGVFRDGKDLPQGVMLPHFALGTFALTSCALLLQHLMSCREKVGVRSPAPLYFLPGHPRAGSRGS